MTTEVFNLGNAGPDTLTYTCSPREAVIAAHAQSQGDYNNTWDYHARYDHLVIEGHLSLCCGDFAAKKEAVQ